MTTEFDPYYETSYEHFKKEECLTTRSFKAALNDYRRRARKPPINTGNEVKK